MYSAGPSNELDHDTTETFLASESGSQNRKAGVQSCQVRTTVELRAVEQTSSLLYPLKVHAFLTLYKLKSPATLRVCSLEIPNPLGHGT